MESVVGEGFVHPALFYKDRAEYLAGTVPFILGGLDAGEPVAVAVPGPRLALLHAVVGAPADRVTWLDMTEAGRNPGRIIPGVLRDFADRHPGGRVRIIGEPIWAGRTPTEYPACVQHEALINLAFEGRDVTILCPYDTSELDQSVIEDAWATHPVVTNGNGTHKSAAYAPERIVADYNRPLPEPDAAAELAFDVSTLPTVRRFVVQHALALGLDPDRTGDMEVAVNELAANSVRYGGGSGILRLWGEDGHVVGEVRDAGLLTDPLVGRRPVALATDGGRGVLLVNHLADLVRMHTTAEGTAIRVYMAKDSASSRWDNRR